MTKQCPRVGARDAKQVACPDEDGFGDRPALFLAVIMLVKVGDGERRKDLLSDLGFLVITVAPWAVCSGSSGRAGRGVAY